MSGVPDVLSFAKEGALLSLQALPQEQLPLCGTGDTAVR
jgi:hypothetical protein